MFISNNCASLQLQWKETLVKHQTDSKFYEKDSLQIFILHFMSLLRAKFPKNSRIWARISFNFLGNVPKPTSNASNAKFNLSEKIGNAVSYQVRQIFATFWN